ncbi:MAG: class I SAM-dependent methyltransferase [Chloroflexi bacterium]|nr:class I SAM-dependent methyltransferase [Chloroflexota bacterium]
MTGARDEVLSGERVVPGELEFGAQAWHLRKYLFARRFAEGKRVLDCGCGVGWGTAMLAEAARWTVGVDMAEPVVRYARERYGHPRLTYVAMDVTRLAFPAGTFDLVVSIEVFEHIADSEAFLVELHRVLRPGGHVVLSTPNAQLERWQSRRDGWANAFHVNLTDPAALRAALARQFQGVVLYGLRRRGNPLYNALRALDVFDLRLRLFPHRARSAICRGLGVPAAHEVGPEDILVETEATGKAQMTIAVATKG